MNPLRLLRSYIFWTYERGSLHYDVMVTLILLFIFVTPHFIDFKDKPVTVVPRRNSQVVVKSSSNARTGDVIFTYEVRAQDLGDVSNDAEIRAALLRVIRPIAGDVTVESYTPVIDSGGKTVAYDAIVTR